MSGLTDQDHWDAFHSERLIVPDDPAAEAGQGSRLRKLVGGKLYAYTRTYFLYQLFEVILPRYLPRSVDHKVLELGSAPGLFLLEFAKTFGYQPFGVEYSEAGVRANRRVFAAHSIPPENVIQANFFDASFQSTYRNAFDVVTSYSLIEHFTAPADVAARHVNLLRPGGHLIVLVPNLRGANYSLYKFFNAKDLASHNLEIMDREPLVACFPTDEIECLHIGYLGTFTFQLFNVERDARRWPLLKICKKAQSLLNIGYRLVLRDRGVESRTFSPWILFVGRKKMAGAEG